jgi:DNA (cytosine-5)-methyltransferase 1
MTIGLQEAARRAGYQLKVALALDSDAAAIEIYKANLPMADARVADVSEVFNGGIGAPLTAAERKIRETVGEVDVLLGGPPCQGHSDLNNHTRRKDPKNALYSRMARAAEVLRPRVVIIENVTTVQWDEGGVVDTTRRTLIASGYSVAGRVLDLRRIGVPQRRKRFVLVGSTLTSVDPSLVLEQLANSMPGHPDRTVRWAIADLMAERTKSTYDTASRISDENAERIDLLFDKGLYDLPNEHRPECHRDGEHSYVSMYGRLRWTRPAQTLTTGFGSMGQGRYVHPERRRTLTPHEAARLQTFPDWFDFGDETRRGVLATVIGNAVPPLLTLELGRLAIPAVVAAREAGRHQRKRT